MSEDLIKAVKDGVSGVEQKLTAAIEKYEGQVGELGKADNEIRSEVKSLSEQFKKEMDELAQRMEKAGNDEPQGKSAGDEFVGSDAYKALIEGRADKARVHVKNTITSDSNTVFEVQRPGIIPGNFAPVTVRSAIPTVRVVGESVKHIKEDAWTNNAREVTQAATKPESDLTFTTVNWSIETVAHWTKITEQLAADAPAVVDYVNRRLRHGLATRVDQQLILGNGTSPNLSGLTDSGNYTAFTASSGDNLADAVNRAKYTMWTATGTMPDTVIVNPADYGAFERTREGTDGLYLFGGPSLAGMRLVLSAHVGAGEFIVANMSEAAVIFEREGAVVEIGRDGNDFTKNLLTIRAEERLALAVMRPSLVYYGDYTA